MNDEDPDSDDSWNTAARNETETQRLDRNWSSLLQELRVVQTGVQFLTGFLLTLPFQNRFSELSDAMQDVYLATVTCSIGATVFLVAPVGMHRLLFRQRKLKDLVATSHKFAIAGLVLLGLALTGVVAIIFDTVAGELPAVIAAAVTALAFAYFWLVFPLLRRRSS